MRLVYLNANLIYGECLKLITRRNIRTGVLTALRAKGYVFITSILTKTEILHTLIVEKQLSALKARIVYECVRETFNIQQIESLNKRNLLTNTFMDLAGVSRLDFKDALHLAIASTQKLLVVTHDKKFIKNASTHECKQKFYSAVVKPEELLKA